MDAEIQRHPVRITPPEGTLGTFNLLRTVIKNPMEIWPVSVYREPLVRWTVFGRDMIFVMAPDLVHEALVEKADAFDKGELMRRALKPILGEAILTADGARWRWQRRAAAPIFRQEMVLGYVPVMVAAAARTAQRLLAGAGTQVNMSHEMMRTTFDVILETIFSGHASLDVVGIEEAITRYVESIGWITALALLRAPRGTPYPGYLKARRAGEYLKRVLAEVVTAQRASPVQATNLASQLMAATDPDSGRAMNDVDLRDNLLTFITAGHETTAVALTWTLYLLSLHPHVEERVVAEISSVVGAGAVGSEHIDKLAYTRQVFLESMRLYPPGAVLARAPTRDVQLGTEMIAQGTPVYIPIYTIHRHAALWSNPDAFDPDRFAPDAVKARHRYAYLPFGAGPRICIGASFALTEAVAVLATLLKSVRMRLVPGYVPQIKLRATLRPAAGMPMIVERRAVAATQ